MTTIKMSKKNKEMYSTVMFNKNYDKLTEQEKNSVLKQYAREHCILTEEEQQILIQEEEYGKYDVPKVFITYYG